MAQQSYTDTASVSASESADSNKDLLDSWDSSYQTVAILFGGSVATGILILGIIGLTVRVTNKRFRGNNKILEQAFIQYVMKWCR